jgi:hypothetical protein
MQANPDRSDMLDTEPVTLEPDSVPVTREENRIEPISRFQSRVPRVLAGFDAPKEIGERFIKPAQRSLGAAEVNRGEPAVIRAFVFKPAGLIGVAARDLPFVVEPFDVERARRCRDACAFQA